MSKMFMFGLLFVTTSALAFSGLVGGGSSSHKEHVYKGGVDAIGIHFNGKPADSQGGEETCPGGTQCGDGCCQGDNVCHQDTESGEYQCCSEELNYCCPINQAVYPAPWDKSRGLCCDGTVFCKRYDSEGNCKYYECCEVGKQVLPEKYDTPNGEKMKVCCPPGATGYCSVEDCDGQGPICCESGKMLIKDSKGDTHCCPEGSTSYVGGECV